MPFEDKFVGLFHQQLPYPMHTSFLNKKSSASDKLWKRSLRSSFKLPRYGTIRSKMRQKSGVNKCKGEQKCSEKSACEAFVETDPIILEDHIKSCLPLSSDFCVMTLNSSCHGLDKSKDFSHFDLTSTLSTEPLAACGQQNTRPFLARGGKSNFYGSDEMYHARTDYSCRMTPKSTHSSSCNDLSTIQAPKPKHKQRFSVVSSSFAPIDKCTMKPPLPKKPLFHRLQLTEPLSTCASKQKMSPVDVNNNVGSPDTSFAITPRASVTYSGHKYHSHWNLQSHECEKPVKDVLGGSVADLNLHATTINRKQSLMAPCSSRINFAEMSSIKLRPVMSGVKTS